MRKIFVFDWKAIFFLTIFMSCLTNLVTAQTLDDSSNLNDTKIEPAGVSQLSALTTQGIFLNRIQSLEEQLSQLKAELVTSEINLMQLKSQLDLSQNTEARLIIHSKDQMGQQYVLLESVYWVDGKEIARLVKEDSKVPLYNSLIPEGEHQIQVEKLYQRKSSGPLAPDQQTFRLKNSTVLTMILGKTSHVEVVAVQKDKRSEEKITIRFDVKVLPNEKPENVPVSVLEMPSLKKAILAKETYLTIMVQESSNPSLTLEKQTIFIDKQKVPTINPSLVAGNGQVIFDALMSPGEHTVNSVLEYKVSGELATLLKTKQIKLKFFDQVSVRPGYKTTLHLKGYEKEASVVLSEVESKGLTEITEELLREQQSTVEPKKVSSHG